MVHGLKSTDECYHLGQYLNKTIAPQKSSIKQQQKIRLQMGRSENIRVITKGDKLQIFFFFLSGFSLFFHLYICRERERVRTVVCYFIFLVSTKYSQQQQLCLFFYLFPVGMIARRATFLSNISNLKSSFVDDSIFPIFWKYTIFSPVILSIVSSRHHKPKLQRPFRYSARIPHCSMVSTQEVPIW